MDSLIVLREYDPKILGRLLADKTTGKNIIWATDSYSDLGDAYQRNQQIQLDHIHRTNLLQPRIFKSQEIQKERTKKKAEVFTPAWICNLMNNQIDEELFGRQNVFNRQTDKSWTATQDSIEFGKETDWKDYVKTKVLEITCGEAPYLVSRYDASTGKEIPMEKRIGMLDRKLRIVTENTDTPEDWYKWAIKALQSTYGYEFQGDSLFLGRVNVYLTFEEAMEKAWHLKLTRKQKNEVSNTICWNLFQMDGLTDNIPIGIPQDRYSQISLFDDPGSFESEEPIAVKINWWDNRASFKLKEMKENYSMGNRKLTRGGGQEYLNSESSVISPKKRRKFGVVIGNPPYQESDGGNKASAVPIYNKFYNSVVELNPERISFVIPDRWFSGGRGLDAFREQMKSDTHIRYLYDFQNASECFPGMDISGGICYFIRDINYNGQCKVVNHENPLNNVYRYLNEFPVVIRSNKSVSILEKILDKNLPSLSAKVSSQKPFGLRTFVQPTEKGDLQLRWNKGKGPIDSTMITTGQEMIDKTNVIVS